MKMIKFLIGLTFLATFAAGAAWLDWKLILLLGGKGSLLAGAAVSIGLVAMLARVPEGAEDADGFHVAPGHGQRRPERVIQTGRFVRPLKLDVARLFSSS